MIVSEPTTVVRIILQMMLVILFLAGCDTVRTKAGIYGPETVDSPPRDSAFQSAYSDVQQKPAKPEYVLQSSEIPEGTPGVKKVASQQPASKEAIEAFTDLDEGVYRIGPGDEFSFLVRGRGDISHQSITVAPDGLVALPRIGLIKIQGMTLAEATEHVRKALLQHYENPEVTLLMRFYKNNRIFMLGQVSRPGVVDLPGAGTLLQAIAMSGGVIKDNAGNSPPVNRAIIGRGKDKIIWIDLQDLLENGNMGLNARLKNGDVVFIPQGQSVIAYIMGQVRQPGPMLLRSPMTILEAIARSGGLTLDGDPSRVYLVRPEGDKSIVYEIDTNLWVERGDMRSNLVLREGDLVYVPERGVSRFHYYLTHLLPTLTVVDFAAAPPGKN